MLPRHGEEGNVCQSRGLIRRRRAGPGPGPGSGRADLLHVVAAVNGVIDLLPAVRKLCEEKES